MHRGIVMGQRLTRMLDGLERELEAPIYALERLRDAVANDASVTPEEASRLTGLDASGAGRSFGPGWASFLAMALAAANCDSRPRPAPGDAPA
jgi:hypothetical protein